MRPTTALFILALLPTAALCQEDRIRAILATRPPSLELLPTLTAEAQALLAASVRTPVAEALAHKALAWVAMSEKQHAIADKHLSRSLEFNPNDGETSAWLATVTKAAKQTPNWRSLALFHYARAATYTGPGALPETARNGILEFARKGFESSFGKDEKAFQALLAATATQALPPPNFTINASAAAPAAPKPQ